MHLLVLATALAAVPLPTWPDCGEPDRPDLCPSDLGQEWTLLSHVPAAWQAQVRPEELPLGTGVGADRAWRLTTGRTDVVIAVLDSGIKWDDPEVLRKHWLNVAELPFPEGASSHDANGDGVVNIDDYAADTRVRADAGVDAADGVLDPSDLITVFSDGVDDDGNGYVDDIAGWDFFWNDNDPYDDTRYGHGSFEARVSAGEGGDGGGIGVCPNCMVMNLRVGDSFVADVQNFALATLYAVDNGAVIVQEALGTVQASSLAASAIDYAWARGVLVVASAADEASYHQNQPGVNHHTLYVHANRFDLDTPEESRSFLAYSNCTNHGARLVLSAPSTDCSSGATAVTAGVAGLVVSAARDAGVGLDASGLYQVLVATAQDIDLSDDPRTQPPDRQWYPSRAGWDRYFGYGRVDAAAAVERVLQGRVPPSADILTPDWFQVVDPERTPTITIQGLVGPVDSWELAWALGDDPADDAFTVFASGNAGFQGELATLDLTTLPLNPAAPLRTWTLDDDIVSREDAVNQFTVTLRLRTRAAEDMGELRKAFYVHHDPQALPASPMRLGQGLESSPVLVDLDGDGVLDIVQGTGDGLVYALHGDGSPVVGWPVAVELLEEVDGQHPAHHLASPGVAAVAAGARASVVGTPAAADLDGDGGAEVVAGTLRGWLHVWGADGRVRPGFPVRVEPLAAPTSPTNVVDEGFFGAPALGDLDGDGDLEIVVGGMDQKVYAWHDDGSTVGGFPALHKYPGFEDAGARIVSSAALGDLDGDGADEIVIGTNETLNGTYGAILALDGDGTLLPGWPVAVFGAYTDALPMVGEGVPSSPALADVDGDGDLEVAVHTIAGDVTVFHHDGQEAMTFQGTADRYGEGSNVWDAAGFPFINSSSWGDLDGDGTPDLVTGSLGAGYALAQLDDGLFPRIDFPLLAWRGADGSMFEAWPRQMEDLQFFMNPAIADVGGAPGVEVLNASGGFLLHAFSPDGTEPEGWPKFTGQWMIASPMVGDVTGDGRLDVVIGTRSGWLFAWGTPVEAARARVEWQGFGHDARNTHNHAAPLEGFNGGTGELAEAGGCGCGGGPARGVWLLAVVAGLGRRRR